MRMPGRWHARRFPPMLCRFTDLRGGQNVPAQCRQRSCWRSPPGRLSTHAVTEHVGVPSIITEIVFVVGSYAADIRACDVDAQAHRNGQLNFRPEERKSCEIARPLLACRLRPKPAAATRPYVHLDVPDLRRVRTGPDRWRRRLPRNAG